MSGYSVNGYEAQDVAHVYLVTPCTSECPGEVVYRYDPDNVQDGSRRRPRPRTSCSCTVCDEQDGETLL